MNQKNSNPRHIVYKSNNILIKYVAGMFFRRVDSLLRSFRARSKFGADIGCGECHLLSILLGNETIGPVVAYDLSTADLKNAKLFYPDFTYVQGDARHIAFREQTFDYVLALEIIEHVENPGVVLREIWRIAKPDASILISVPNEPFFCLGNMLRGKYLKRLGRTPGHQSFWTVPQFKALIADFFVIDQAYIFTVFPWQLYVCRPKQG